MQDLYSIFTLPNNLRVLYLPFKNTSSVFISLLGKAGRRAEKPNEIGAAHFLEHLSFDGTFRRPNAFKINKFLDEQGAQHNAFTHSETVEYFVKTLSEKAEFGFEYLSDVFLNSTLDDIEKEKKVILEEHASQLDKPDSVSGRRFLKLLYPNLNIGRDFSEEDNNIANFNKDLLTRFRSRLQVAENFVLTVCGNVAKEDVLGLSQKYFSTLPSGEEIQFVKAQFEKEAKIDVFHRDFNQSILMIGFKGFSHKEKEKFIYSRILAKILSSGFSSRLYQKLRNQLNFVYTVKANTTTYSDTGYLSVETKVNEDKLTETNSVILSEIKRLLAEGVFPEEIEKGKNMLLSDFLFSLEKVEIYAGYHSQQVLFGGELLEVKDYVEVVKKATKEKLMDVANEIFTDSPKICILTPKLERLGNIEQELAIISKH
ncbi:MAG: insulinase family protein [Patescibacteria group bacterium]|nr:insulinase family protein [Patescibacteria group bacterium]